MPTLSNRALLFINKSDEIINLFREIFYSIEDQPVEGYFGEHESLYEINDKQRELLKNAAHDIYWRLKDILPNERRDRIRKAVAAAVELILGFQRTRYKLLPDEKAYQAQEIIQQASTFLIEANNDLIQLEKQSGEKRQTDKSKSKSKHIGAKPLLNSGEAAQISMEYNSPGIHTRYNAFGGYSNPPHIIEISQSYSDSERANVAKEIMALCDILDIADSKYPNKRIAERARDCHDALSELYSDLALDKENLGPGHTKSRQKARDTIPYDDKDTILSIEETCSILGRIANKQSWDNDVVKKLRGWANILSGQRQSNHAQTNSKTYNVVDKKKDVL